MLNKGSYTIEHAIYGGQCGYNNALVRLQEVVKVIEPASRLWLVEVMLPQLELLPLPKRLAVAP
ncbi:hypothetical protein [Kalamiella sp. sgz302252]|uniref:hypothetical protein n=1 Tax=Pantoea sp. sgz302252 TaxID=3341827 RepID=UPI0036D30DA7